MDPPSSEEFSWFYTLKSNKGDLGFYYFAKQVTKDVQVVTKIKESLGNQKDAYLFTPEVRGHFGIRGHFGEPSKYLMVSLVEYIYM